MSNVGKARGLRWNEIEAWIARAAALGLVDVVDGLTLERMDATASAAETAALIGRARAACLLHVLDLGADDDDALAA